MKVAQVTLRFDAPGGVETNVREVATRLQSLGADVTVYASDLFDEASWDRRTGYRPAVDGVPVRRFPVYRRLVPGLTLPLFTGLVGALADDAPDVIHAHSHRYGHVLQAALVARARRIPLVVSTHYHPADPGETAVKRGLLRGQDQLFGATAYRVARAIVVETEREARLVREFAPADRLRVIPPGIDLDAWRAPAPPPPGGLPDGFVLYAGRLAPNKGLGTLVEAIALLPAAERPTLLLMGPDWGERARLVALAHRLGVDGYLRLTGPVDDPATYRAIFRSARLFVLPSFWEAFGLVLLEAMAARVPIVATAVGGVPEVLEEGRAGALVPPGDAGALAAAIARLLADADAARSLVTAGAARVDGLTWAKAAERHLALYREVAGGAAAPSS